VEFASDFLFPKELNCACSFYEARPAGLTRYGVGQNAFWQTQKKGKRKLEQINYQ